ncbi:hypothetical protein [Tomitella biformata]|uniref:hypothetical protein n=1 Tax=Tomitella biformata TaxID=630403 RepID=UPI00046630F9|nr:hypothetical protein [Tomitella biformata]
MRAFNKVAIAAAAVTIAFAGSASVAGAASPFEGLGAGSLGSLSNLFPTPVDPGPVDPGPVDPGPVDPEPEEPAPEACSIDLGTPEAGEGLAVDATKLTCLVDGDKITVSGTGFSGANFGIYVGLAQDDQYSATDASKFLSTQWVKAPSIVDGSWSVELDVVAANEANESDCTVNACSIYTLSAHGNPDRTQDTKTPVTFK